MDSRVNCIACIGQRWRYRNNDWRDSGRYVERNGITTHAAIKSLVTGRPYPVCDADPKVMTWKKGK